MFRARFASTARHLATSLALAFAPACSCDGGDVAGIAGVLTLSPTEVDFGEVFIGATARRTLELTNHGTGDLKIDEACLLGGAPFSVDAAAGVSCGGDGAARLLQPGEHITLTLVYQPVLPEGPDADVLRVTHGTGDATDVPVRGVGVVKPAPAIEVCTLAPGATEPACAGGPAIDFGLVPLDETRDAVVVIRSVGAEDLHVLEARIVTLDPGGEFTADPDASGAVLSPGAETRVTVHYAPGDGGDDRAALRLVSDDPDRVQLDVLLSGRGDGPKICPEPAFVIDFGNVEVGQEKRREVTFLSCGTRPLDVTTLDLTTQASGEFALGGAPSLPHTMPPDGRLSLTAVYTPRDVGSDTARVEVGSSDPDTPVGFIELRGRGTRGPECDLQAQPAVLDFGGVAAGQRTQRTLTLSNQGQAPCTLTAVAVSAGAPPFAIVAVPPLPALLDPGTVRMVTIELAPPAGSAVGTGHRGVLTLSSNDADLPAQDVALQGETGRDEGCSLDVTPPQVNFGDVALGRSGRQQVTLTARANCILQQVALDPATPGTFAITNLSQTVPTLLLAGRALTVEVTYRPTRPGVENGALHVSAGVIPRVVGQATLVGRGLGPQLCIDPRSLDFGVLEAGQTTDREASLASCGTADVTVSSLQIAPGSSPAYAVRPAGLPRALAPGASMPATVRYSPNADGRDDGVLWVDSDDPLQPRQAVRLVGVTAPPGTMCGNVAGRICAKDGQIYLAGARVWVDVGGEVVETLTDSDGYFVLTCVPVGSREVRAQSGSWSTAFEVEVRARETTALALPECVDLDAVRIAVAWGRWDQIEEMLGRIGVPFDFYEQNRAADLLLDRALLFTYDIVFLNCGMDEELIDDFGGPTRQNLIDFVAGGGSVYASDWSFDFVEVPWPSWIDFQNDDNIELDVQGGPQETVTANILDAGMAATVGRSNVRIHLCCTWVDAADMASGAVVRVEAPRREQGGRVVPLMVTFQPSPGGGTVVYTPFHNADQTESQREVDLMLQYMVFQL